MRQKRELFVDATNKGLNQAIKSNYIDCVKLLLEHDSSTINNREPSAGCAPLHQAVLCGHMECIHFLINKGADINLVTLAQNTLLHCAANHNQTECLSYFIPLLRHHINSKNSDGHSPLMCAIERGSSLCATLLIQENANINIGDNHNQTALHFAASKNLPEMIKVLIQHGADANCVTHTDFIVNNNNYGLYTPLHVAAHFGNIKALDALLQHGADTTLKTQTGKTAFELLVETLVKKRR